MESTTYGLPPDRPPSDENCPVCLEPLVQTEGPIDERLLFRPSRCRQFHSFHLQCAKSAAKSEVLKKKIEKKKEAAIACPVCREVYDEREDLGRLLPPERRLLMDIRVRPLDEASVFDLVVWERYDSKVLHPRDDDPAAGREGGLAIREVAGWQFACSDLPPADDQATTEVRPQTFPPEASHRTNDSDRILQPASETTSVPSPPFFLATNLQTLLRDIMNEMVEQLQQSEPSERSAWGWLMEMYHQYRHRERLSLDTSPPTPFQQILNSHEALLKSIQGFDDGVRQVRRRLNLADPVRPNYSGRITRNMAARIRRDSGTSEILSQMEANIRGLREHADNLAADIFHFGFSGVLL